MNYKALLFIALLTAFFLPACQKQELKPNTILFDSEVLLESKNKIFNNDAELQPALDQLLLEAKMMLSAQPLSVTDKEKLPPSGNKHDYVSYSRYWWPDPTQPEGLPYIRKDGLTNPASQNPTISDRPKIGTFGKSVETLGLAYYFTNDISYAQKAAEMIRVWFLNEETRMNPNMNHSQCKPGHNEGSKSGVLDGRLLVKALEGSLLIASSNQLSQAEFMSLKTWVSKYLTWLTTNELALKESISENNHGSYYDAQAMYFALFCGNKKVAKEIAIKALDQRIYFQIEEDGSMPAELARTRPVFYSVYNLHALYLIAYQAAHVDVDLWEKSKPDARLKKAMDYIAPYVDPQQEWPSNSVKKINPMEFYPVLKVAFAQYANSIYVKSLQKLSLDETRTHRANLAYPSMR